MLENEKGLGQSGPVAPCAVGKPIENRPADPPRHPIAFALRTTIAALTALAVAHLLSIHHPWWAAMTVWLVAQPTRGLLMERSVARLVGTICGAVAGASILIIHAYLPVTLILLAFWLACCAGLGTIFRHFRNYGFVLAGYTAGIVVLFGLGDGHTDTVLAQDRVLCTLIGIACSMLLSFRALPSRKADAQARARNLLGRVLQRIKNRQADKEAHADASLIAEIGGFDRAIDEQSAGSIRGRADARRLRHISGILLELLALGGSRNTALDRPFAPDDPFQRARHMARDAAAHGHVVLAGALEDLAKALEPGRLSALSYFRFDFDRVASYRAAMRPVVALAVASAIWLAAGWQAGSMMAMTAVLFTSLFSSHDHGNHMVVQVLLGTLAGAAMGLLVRLLLLPHAEGLLTILVCVTPFLLVSARLMRKTVTAKMAIDMAMTFLLTAQPGTAPVAAETAVLEALAIVSGVVIAVAIFWLVLPSTPDVRRRLLARRIATLTHRIACGADEKTLASHHETLRSAQVQLLDVTEVESPLFKAAQACLAAAAESRRLKSATAREASIKASAALDALATSNTRRKNNA
ncbi:FUSC family protein [Agrobacterium tumefaciens]|nr:FUSC family protein [Agrobacterium tumefaciens]